MEKLIGILKGVCPGVDFENEKALCDDGIINSLDIVLIVSELMDAYGVEIDIDDLVPENFNTAESILALVEKAQG
ncbi:MAG: acyl carrier protein [Oscillospiraceae bacterium]|nr:acyl carrier protein [Oscillospiraceae bacterium]